MDGFFEKKYWNFSKIAKGSKFAKKCDWNSKISKNVQRLGFSKKQMGFSKKKLLNFFKIAKISIFAVKCN